MVINFYMHRSFGTCYNPCKTKQICSLLKENGQYIIHKESGHIIYVRGREHGCFSHVFIHKNLEGKILNEKLIQNMKKYLNIRRWLSYNKKNIKQLCQLSDAVSSSLIFVAEHVLIQSKDQLIGILIDSTHWY